MKIYTIEAAQQAVEHLTNIGYEYIQLSEGVLGIGDCVLLSHDPGKYNFLIREKYLNEWSSGQTIRRFAKVSEKLEEEIERACA